MSEIKPKKERRFLKTLGRVGEILVEQVLLKLGSSIIKKIGGKKTLPSILFLLASLSLFAQYPNTGNKQRLGFQTTGDGLTWRGSISDTASIQPINNQSAWVILDTINLKFYTFDFTSNVWNLVGGGGGAAFIQPVDSLFFNVNVPTNNVDTAKMRWDSDLATVVLGLNDNVPNELGFKNFWLVKNQTGSTITKGSLVYANGTVGASGRITVAKFIANSSIDAKYLLGITAHDLTDGEDGYVISFGKIRQVNTDTFAAGAILYPSPTVAGVWTDVEPIAPNIDMPIGFCINSSVNNGTIAIRVASGYKLSELHDVAISSPVEKASLYYSGGLWRDTTASLLVSDTASMLTPYFKGDTTSLSNRINAKLNISDTTNMLVPYLRKADTTNMLLPYFRDADTTSLNLTSRFATKLNISDTASMLTPYFRDADTSTLNLTSRFAEKQNILVSGNNIKTVNSNNLLGSGNVSVGTVTNVTIASSTPMSITNSTTTPEISMPAASASVSGYLQATAFSLFQSKQGTISLTTTGSSGASTFDGSTLNIPNYTLSGLGGVPTTRTITINSTTQDLTTNRTFNVGTLIGTDTVSLSNRINLKFNTADTSLLNLTSRFAAKLNISDTASMLTNYLRSGTAASTYLTQSNAASTYLPLTGGVLTGGLTGTTGTFNTKLIAGNLGGSSGSPIFTAGLAGTETEFHIYQGTGYEGSPTTLRLTNNNGFYYQNGLFLKSIMERGLDEYNGRIGIMGTDFMILTKNSRIGIFNASPSTTLDVNGTLNATGATTLGSTLNVTSNITANSFIKSGGLSTQFLKADGTVDGTSYLPLTGGTLTGTINRQESNFNESPNTLYFNILNYFARKDNVKENQTAQITFTDRPGTSQYPNAVRTSDIYLMTAHNWNGVAYSQYLDTTLSIVANQDGGRVGISKLNPSYKLDVNGTLGVTGATTLNNGLNITGTTNILNGQPFSTLNIIPAPTIGSTDNTIQTINTTGLSFKIGTTERMKLNSSGLLTVTDAATFNSSAVFNEGAADADFRVESIGNNNMVFVDASTDRVGIGTNSPTKTLDVNGELKVLSAGTFGGRLNTNWMERTYSNSTSTSLTVSVNTTWLKLENNSTITLTLPNAADYPGKELHIKNAGTGAVNSLSSNIEPLNSTTIGTAILASGGGKWATLVSDGTYWVIMAGN